MGCCSCKRRCSRLLGPRPPKFASAADFFTRIEHDLQTPKKMCRSRPNVIMTMIRSDVSVDELKYQNGNTVLLQAAMTGSMDVVIELVPTVEVEYGVDLDMQNNNGNTALIFAVRNNHVDIVKVLLDFRASLDVRNNKCMTPLMYAARAGQADLVQLLVQNGADLNLQNSDGDTAIMLSLLRNRWDISRYLAEEGTNLNLQNRSGWTVLMATDIRKPQGMDMIDYLMEKDANPDLLAADGDSLLTWAAECGKPGLVKHIVDTGGDVNTQNAQGNTAFMLLMRYDDSQDLDIAGALINQVDDINRQNHVGDTALMMAAEGNHLALAKLLLERGADVDLENDKGFTANSYALQNDMWDLYALLQRTSPRLRTLTLSRLTSKASKSSKLSKPSSKIISIVM
eukprot:TRINITY_DN47426_c0_g1_i1.p1 TRINITY_DN47426_c0_g1~~TRINITY_DN47426_c0_g1_i1.p1  ORF type:complete len:407 (-),score=91.02 TRINITY_DN47426_c0_g1_i1:9-1202(-)